MTFLTCDVISQSSNHAISNLQSLIPDESTV